MITFRVAPRILVAALAVTLAASASAQVFVKRMLADHDQRRRALPNQGSMYCEPTAYSDIISFLASHGMAGLDLHAGDHYALVTKLISILGDKMDTDPEDGTNGSDGFDAITDWFDDHSNLATMHIAFGPSGSWGVATMHNWLAFGAILRIGYGRYAIGPGNVITRQSGHAVAVAGYDFHGSQTFYVADPAFDDGNIDKQGPYTLDEKILNNINMTYDGDPIKHARYTDWSGSDGKQIAIVDDMHVILPLWAGWLEPAKHVPAQTHPAGTKNGGTTNGGGSSTFHAVIPTPLVPGGLRSIDVPIAGTVKDWCIDPGDAAIYTLANDGTVNHVDLIAKTSTKVAVFPGARKLAVAGKNFELFVLRDAGASDEIVKYDPFTKKQGSLKVDKGITSIEPDRSTLGIAALHPSLKRLYRIDSDLLSAKPQAIDLPEGNGEAFVAMSRKGGFTVARAGAKSLVQAEINATPKRLALVRAPMLQSFQPIGKGLFLVQEGNRLATVDAASKPAKSAFDGLAVQGTFRIAQGWKAFRKADVTGPGWKQVLPQKGQP